MKKTVILSLAFFFAVHGLVNAEVSGKRKIASDQPLADSTSFFYGPVSFYSADGATPRGGTFSLIKRTTSPANPLFMM